MDKNILEAMDSIDELNPYAAYLDGNTLSRVKSWISTGCYALDVIMSGRIRGGGVPSGRIVIISGPESCGKTFITNTFYREAQAAGRHIISFDTENAQDEQTATSVGADPAKIKHVPVANVEEIRNQAGKFFDTVMRLNLQGKFAMGIDSLGNLEGLKESKDNEKGKVVSDQGTRAKDLKGFLRNLTHRAARADTPVLCSNHTYANPTELYPSVIKPQAGGSGVLYLPSITVQLAKKPEKISSDQTSNRNATDDAQSISKQYNGLTVRALTIKNRFVPPFLESEFYVNFSSGLSKYSGLLEIALGYGAVIQTGSTFALPDGTKLGYYKNWRDNVDLWENTIIPQTETRLEQALKFGKLIQSAEAADRVENKESESIIEEKTQEAIATLK